jgi:hypothetical protein
MSRLASEAPIAMILDDRSERWCRFAPILVYSRPLIPMQTPCSSRDRNPSGTSQEPRNESLACSSMSRLMNVSIGSLRLRTARLPSVLALLELARKHARRLHTAELYTARICSRAISDYTKPSGLYIDLIPVVMTSGVSPCRKGN